MERKLSMTRTTGIVGRLVAGVLIAVALLAGGGRGRPQPAVGASKWNPPQIMNVRMEKPDTAYVTFRETNDVGPDVSGSLQYFIYWAEQGDGVAVGHKSVAPAGNGRVHTVTVSGLHSETTVIAGGVQQPPLPECFAGFAYAGKADINHPFMQLFDVQSDMSNEVCADWSSAGTELSSLPCGISGIEVTNATMPIRDYDYTYYCDGSYRFQVTALFDTRPLNNDPANGDKHLAFEMLKDGDTQIIASWICATDPWGVADTTYCTPKGDPTVQNPNPNFAVQNGPLPLSVRFLNDEDRQHIATALRQALNAPSGTNLPLRTLIADVAPAAPLPQAPAAPTNFAGVRDPVTRVAINLTWDAAAGADYYYLTAFSHDGNQPVALGHGAPKLDKSQTRFTVESGDNAANLLNGVDFKLQACNAGGCAPAVTVTVM
jgi:hypothetical protein